MYWEQGRGQLDATEGLAFKPRWRWKKLPQTPIVAEVTLQSAEQLPIDAKIEWTPAPGQAYELPRNQDVSTSLKEVAGNELAGWVEETPFACFFAELTTKACPSNPARTASERLSPALGGAMGGRISFDFSATSVTMKSYFASGIRAQIPELQGRVMVFAVDGLDWDFVDPLIASGRMPNLGRLVSAGTSGRMKTLVPILSPLIWTSVATGVGPDRHGVLDFVEKDSSGQLVPVTARSRKSPAIWEMASVLGRSVGVVAWWASWPASEVRGTLVSDRLYYTLTQGLDKNVFRSDPANLVYPEARTAEFTQLRDRAVKETDWRAVSPFIEVSAADFESSVAADLGMEDPVDGFRRILASTRTYMGAGLVVAEEKPVLTMVYLEGTDTIGHLLARYQAPPVDTDVTVEEAARYAEAIPRYYQVADRWIGRYLEACPLEGCTWILVSDHGFKWGSERPRNLGGFSGRTAPLWHAEDAVFLVAGTGTRRLGRVPEEASVYDVAPTIAAALQIPADASWQGEPLPGSPAPVDLPSVDYSGLVELPSALAEGPPVSESADPEYIAKLQALGYLAGGGGGSAPASPSATTPAMTETSAQPKTRGELNNLAVLKINEKQYAEAEQLLRQAIELSPEYSSPHYNLRRMYMEMGWHEDADRELWIAVDKGLRAPERTLDQAAADYDNLDLPSRSDALLAEAIRRFPQHEPFYVHRMVVQIRLEQCPQAVLTGQSAAPQFPDSAPVHAFYGLAAACAGDAMTAERELRRSLQINPNQPRLQQVLLAGLE